MSAGHRGPSPWHAPWTLSPRSAKRRRSIGTREAAPPQVAVETSFAPRSRDPEDKDQGYGKEDRGLHQITDPGGQGEPLAAGRSRPRPARAEHHAVLQGLQRPDAEHGAGNAGARGDHRLRRPHLLIYHQDPAQYLFPD